ncbi:hypothetical protein GN958_ATG06658 [Phytophthora infestans]|uniref:Uncharacterized protein n=1 Tax=Phytophthora infestans TaxID=4787 RepID=A0A8S9UWP2_PHYIN|nr:hypothetical protein GN958_ATG06658 [Phytophthora infestans]
MALSKYDSVRQEAILEAKSTCKTSAARANDHKQKTSDGPFVVHVLMYAAKEARHGIRRATPARIAETTEAIDTYLAERPDARVGDIARTHWAISQARQPGDASVSILESAPFRKMQHLDTMSTSHQEDRGADSVLGTLTMELNGSRDMQLAVNVSELRTLLGLPNYSLITEGMVSHFQPPS